MKHKTKTGEWIELSDLEDSHLQNIINRIERLSKVGITLRAGGGGFGDVDDMWYSEEEIIGQEVLDHFYYSEYIKELNSRKHLSLNK